MTILGMGHIETGIVTNLAGSWPEWEGNFGLKFVHIRIRYGMCSIGVGNSKPQARDRATVIAQGREDLAGVTGIEDAVRMLRENGYVVKSVVIPEHCEELEEKGGENEV